MRNINIIAIIIAVVISGCSDTKEETAYVVDTSWVLTACIGVSSWGCGSVFKDKYPTEESCYAALNQINQNKSTAIESNLRRDVVANCKPTGLN